MTNSESQPPIVHWLNAFPRRDWYYEISSAPAPAASEERSEALSDSAPASPDSGIGMVAMLRERGCDFTGPALQIGCGTGVLSLGLAASKAFPAVVVTDPWPECLHATRSKLQQLPEETGENYFATLSGEEWDLLPENTFSLIILHSARQQVSDLTKFIATMARALKPTGMLICDEPSADGYLTMGLMARLMPMVMAKAGVAVSREQTEALQSCVELIKADPGREIEIPARVSLDGEGPAFHGVFMWSKHELEQLQSDYAEGLRIAILNTYDLHGGAARAAWRLHSGLRRIGQQSQMLVMHRTSHDPDVRVAITEQSPDAESKLARWSQATVRHIERRRTRISETYFSPPVPGYDWSLHPQVRRSEIINLHWVAGMISPSGVRALLALNKPIVWTLHDQRAFTGGCHYTAGCNGYQVACGKCPQLQPDSFELPGRILQEALDQVDSSAITVVCPSRWLADCARKSAMFRHSRIEVIPYGLETEIYAVRDKIESRRALELPADGFYFLFGAHSAHDRRKGLHILTAAIRIARGLPAFRIAMDDGRIRFLTYGQDSDCGDFEGVPVISLGYIESHEKMALAYASADIFVCPTLEDNLPNTILEALSCGRPVIASDVGGVPDMVKEGVNGRLVPPDDARALAEVLLQVVENADDLAAWGLAARLGIESEHGLQQQAEKYLKLYQELSRTTPPMSACLPPERVVLPLLPSSWEFEIQDRAPAADELRSHPGADKQELVTIKPIEIAWAQSDGLSFRPSWKGDSRFINSEHALIWDRTKYLPGSQNAVESQKLYEVAYHNGRVILEIGAFGGRGAAVAMCAAMAGQTGGLPQYYGVDQNPGFDQLSLSSVEQFGVDERCVFFNGNIDGFFQKFPVVPTMVLFDGGLERDGVFDGLQALQRVLAPATPVLCRNYHHADGVRCAVHETLNGPYYRMGGLFSDWVLLETTGECRGEAQGLSEDAFQKCRLALHRLYKMASSTSAEDPKWPYKPPAWRPIPAKLPSGQPWPRISIITPSYNQGHYIEQTILSIANQNYPNVEHIVIDGGSTDETVSVLEQYSPLLTSWVSEKDGGQSNAINKGFAKATGEIVTWLNSDDLLAPGALAAIALAFDTSGADMVAGICQLHRDGEIFDQHLTSCADGPLPLDELLDLENHWMSGQFFFQPEVFFKRALLLKVGGNVNEKAHWSMDYELWVRFAQAGAKLKVIGRPVAQFRVHEEQKTQDVSGFKAELQALVDKLRPTLGMPPAPPPVKWRKQKLRIAFFNDIGFQYGAGIAHERLARAARLAGHEVFPLAVGIDKLSEKERALPFVEQIIPSLKAFSPDVVIVGNIHAASLEPSILKEIADAMPTVSILHDSWLLSGRCAYRGGCTKNLTGCDEACPTPNEYPSLDPKQIAPAWQQKMELIQSTSKLVLAANSMWTRREIQTLAAARQAPADSPADRPLMVRLSVPLDIFLPRDQAACRAELNLPADKFILLFSCSDLGDKRKGMDHLVQAIRKLNLPDLVPVCIGYNDRKAPLDLPGLISVGYVKDPYQQALLYSAANLFVAPSLEEA
ncbi:MAG: glycosyltransferase, partial [Luteolibacter sp.]